MKHCPDCKQESDNFGKRKASKDGLQPACVSCMQQRRREAYRNHKQETINRVKRYRSKPGYRKACNAWKDVKLRGGMRCIPPWVKLVDTVPIYAQCQKKGRKYVVDHIIPLNGETVSGLHVPQNLQVLTRKENDLKGNSVV